MKFLAIPAAMKISEPPPILGSWKNLNIAVLVWLVILISLFYGFTRYFS